MKYRPFQNSLPFSRIQTLWRELWNQLYVNCIIIFLQLLNTHGWKLQPVFHNSLQFSSVHLNGKELLYKYTINIILNYESITLHYTTEIHRSLSWRFWDRKKREKVSYGEILKKLKENDKDISDIANDWLTLK